MPSIETGTKNVLINVFTTEPEQQAAGLHAFARFGERIAAGQVPGLISASVHRSTDGTRIVNYVQWQSVEDMQRMLQTPEFRAAFAAQPAVEHADPTSMKSWGSTSQLQARGRLTSFGAFRPICGAASSSA